MINPAFVNHPEEAKLLGEMVLGYGELDISFCMICGMATGQKYPLLHAANQVRSESGRLDIANALAVSAFGKLDLSTEYNQAHKAIRFCLKVRNQWAHAQWGDLEKLGLAFTKTDGDVFAMPLKRTEWHSVTLAVLQKQEAYFEYTRKCILTLEMNLPSAVQQKPLPFEAPSKMHEPSMQSQWSKSALAQLNKWPPLPN